MARQPKWTGRKLERLLHATFGPTCQMCQGSLEEPFCTKCGAPHPYFSIQGFEADGSNLKELLNDCQAGHPEALEGARKEPDIYEGYEYCGFCGEHIFTSENLKRGKS